MLQLPQTKQDIIVIIAIVTNQLASLLIVRTLVRRHHQAKAMGTQYQPFSPIPKDDAPASEVREFFCQTLIDDFNVPPAEAETIASQWRLRGGRELAYFDREAFRSIFGGEVGTILYEKSRKASSRSTKAENRATFFGMKPIGELISVSVEYVLTWCRVSGDHVVGSGVVGCHRLHGTDQCWCQRGCCEYLAWCWDMFLRSHFCLHHVSHCN